MPAKRTPERALEAMWDQEPKSLKDLNAIIEKAGPLVPGATQAVFAPQTPPNAGTQSVTVTRSAAIECAPGAVASR